MPDEYEYDDSEDSASSYGNDYTKGNPTLLGANEPEGSPWNFVGKVIQTGAGVYGDIAKLNANNVKVKANTASAQSNQKLIVWGVIFVVVIAVAAVLFRRKG